MKNKKIKTMIIAGGVTSVICMSTTFAMNFNKTSFYPVIIDSVSQDLSGKKSAEFYSKLFEESKLYSTLIEEFKNIKDFSIEETKKDVVLKIAVDSDKILENEKELYKEELNDLFNKLDSVDNNKNIILEIDVYYEVDENGELEQIRRNTYTMCKSKYSENTLAICKTTSVNIPDSWRKRYFVYNVEKESFIDDNIKKNHFEDKIYNEVYNSIHGESYK